MKYDVWAITLQPGDKDHTDFCFDIGVVVTGWACINGYQNVLAKTSDDIQSEYDSIYGGEDWATDDNRNKAVYALDKIANEIKIGDKLLIRRGNNKLLAVGEVTGDYKYRKDWIPEDRSHVRDVRYTAIAKDKDLFEVMKKHLGKAFSMGHTVYYFDEVDFHVWENFLEECRNTLAS